LELGHIPRQRQVYVSYVNVDYATVYTVGCWSAPTTCRISRYYLCLSPGPLKVSSSHGFVIPRIEKFQRRVLHDARNL